MHSSVWEPLFQCNDFPSTELTTTLSLVTYRSSLKCLLQKAKARGDAISWTCGWNWSWAIGKTAGEEKMSRPKSGNLHLWKHSEYNSYNSSVIQVCSMGHKKCFFDASFWFCFSFSNGEQLLTKSQRKQNKLLPQCIWYLHSCKIQYIGKQWKTLCCSMQNSVRFYFR